MVVQIKSVMDDGRWGMEDWGGVLGCSNLAKRRVQCAIVQPFGGVDLEFWGTGLSLAMGTNRIRPR